MYRKKKKKRKKKNYKSQYNFLSVTPSTQSFKIYDVGNIASDGRFTVYNVPVFQFVDVHLLSLLGIY